MKKLIISLIWLLSFLSVSHAATIKPAQSGQKSIIAKSDDGEIRAGEIWPSPRFTGETGPVISDHLTGLMWAKDANLKSSQAFDVSSGAGSEGGAASWQSALNVIIKLNAEKYLGFNDWRLPNLNELASLLNQEEFKQNVWLGLQGFTNTVAGNYWTSTSVAFDARMAWVVQFSEGNVEPRAKSNTALIWPVRGTDGEIQAAIALPKTGQTQCFSETGEDILCQGSGQDGELRAGREWPAVRFFQNADQTVTDNVTGLVWAHSANLIIFRDPSFGSTAEGKVVWHDALSYVSKLNSESYLGYSDWRLPNRSELVSLVNYAETDPTTWHAGQGFTNLQQHYWSSTSSASRTINAWNIGLEGSVTERNKYDAANGSFVWPVRSGYAKPLIQTPQATLASESSATIQASSLMGSAAPAAPLAAAAAAALSVTTSTLPGGQVGTVYNQPLAATGGTTPYTWTRKSGSLPAGLSLSTAGVISGTPTTAATSTFTVQVKDKVAAVATKTLSIVVSTAPLSITKSSLPDGYRTAAYSQTMTATGGKTAYTWSVTTGTLPAGLSLAASTGVISGTPTATGTSSFTIQVKDANNATASKALTIAVYSLPSISTASLSAGKVGSAYSQTLVASGGKSTLTWSVSAGTLPAGLTLNASSGVISGTPTTAVTSSVTFKVTDANAKTATKALSISVSTTPPTITTSSIPDGYYTIAYSQPLTASGGKSPYTWTRTAGSLPSGLNLSSSGVISGTPNIDGTSNFTVQVKDSNNVTASAAFTMTIAPPVNVTSWVLPTGIVGTGYNQPLTASGGKAPYTWSITRGPLPPGLSFDSLSNAIVGTPTMAGSISFYVQVKDANNKTADATIVITIVQPISISTANLHDSFVGVPYNHAIFASGGNPPYTYSISNGSLPGGLILDSSSGIISGTPNSIGTSSFTVQASDNSNTSASKDYSINVTGYGSIGGVVTDQYSGTPLPGAQVTLSMTGIKSRNSNDLLFSCNGSPVNTSAYTTVAENDAVKLDCRNNGSLNVMQFKARNPFGNTDPFKISWNGVSSITNHDEFLAQSFKPTISGNLTKVSFYLPSGTGYLAGALTAQLKTSLGGDRNTHLAETSSVALYGYASGAAWIELTFPAPAAVVAGQTYYIETRGGVWRGDALSDLYFGDGTPYANGEGFRKYAGSWLKINTSLAFRSYVDNQLDVTISPANSLQFSMSGEASQRLNMSLYKTTAPAVWEYGATIDSAAGPFTLSGEMFGYLYNGDDLTIYWDMANGAADYYDANGWITVKVDNYSADWIYPPTTNLVTDQFSLTYSRTYTATADANGAYLFTNLPDGNYEITITQPAYSNGTLNGTLLPGQALVLPSSLLKAQPATLQGLIRTSMGDPVSGATVNVTDQLGIRSAVSDSNGNYSVGGIVYGSYTASYAAPLLQTKMVTGSLLAGETKVSNVLLYAAPVTLNISAPADGSLVYTNPVILTGTAQNADKITVNTNTASYTAPVENGLFSLSISLNAGPTTLYCTASSKYFAQDYKTITVTRTPFILKNLGDVGNVAVMETDGSYDGKKQDGSINDVPRKSIATEYFKSHGDVDFLVFLSTFDYAMPEAGAQGFYLPVKNDTLGINQPVFNNTAQFGNAGNLQGTIDLGNVTALAANPYGAKLDDTVTTLNHELMHRFGAFVRFKNPDGTLNTALLGKDSTHWSYLLDSKGSLMYGSGWINNNDGTFTAASKQSSFSPLDLYLMGMIPKEQVPPMTLIENPAVDKTQLPSLGATVTGTTKTVTIDDIIAAEGARVPSAASSQKQFNVGFVLLTRAGDNTTAATQAIETLRKTWAGRFAELTQGKGGVASIPAALEVTIDSPLDGATIIGPDVNVSGTIINTTGAETGVTVNGIPAAVSGNRFIANHVPLQLGSSTLTVTATDANGLTSTITKSVTAQAGNYLRISAGTESGVAPVGISISLNASFVIDNPQISTTGPIPVTIEPGASPFDFSVIIPVEGIYTFNASTIGSDGLTYSDMITIVVNSKEKIDSLIRAKWSSVNSLLTTGNIPAALRFFTTYSRDKYQAIFNEVSAIFPNIAATYRDLTLLNIIDGVARYKLTTNQNGAIYAYDIVFEQEENGLWLLRSY